MKAILNKYRFDGRIVRILSLLCLFLFCLVFSGVGMTKVPALIPMPQKLVWNGQKFKIGKDFTGLVQRLTSALPAVPMNPKEAYTLAVTADSAILTATTTEGLFRGLQTVRQLTFEEKGERIVAGCSITDWPAFSIRGFMQDAGRNFMPLPMLKEQIDVMAAYKLNVFHFHLTDNPGWRLGSKKYPQLKAASSMSRWPGKYYSQEDFLQILNYCGERYITMIPELDIPGHCEAFRKAFAIDSMSDPRVKPILLDLIDELCSLAPKERMPFLHLGTDEVWQKHERPAPGLLAALIERVRSNGREVIVWSPGQPIDHDQTSITQLWSAAGKPKEGHPYIDSRLNYLNHLDPLAGVAQLYFDRICNKAHGDSLALGGILCCWNDNNVTKPYDILVQNPVYPGLITYSETSWKGQPVDLGDQYLAKLPSSDHPLFEQFKEFESRMILHRDLFFKGKPFPYIRQSEMEWSLIGPFDNHGDAKTIFPVENSIQKNYTVDGHNFNWQGPVHGGTIHIRHFFGYPSWLAEKTGTVYAATNIWSPKDQVTSCWIGFHDWSRSGGRRGGPLPEQGEWHTTVPQVWLNGEVIAPPIWKHPGLGAKTDEIPFEDENYFFREPKEIRLKKGWNRVLLKIPQNGKSWKWMFTFVPVKKENGRITEVEGLKYSTNPQLSSGEFKLAPVFGEHMVFQQNQPIVIGGMAGVNDQIEVFFGKNASKCTADPMGSWKLNMPIIPAGGPYPLQILVNGKTVIDWKDILVGEVWFCSGQSNMLFRLDQSENGSKESDVATVDQLRLMNDRGIAETSDISWDSATLNKINSHQYFEGAWQKCSQEEAAGFSAIAYYFGKKLREKLQVPVGLIQVAVGGAPVESFIDHRTILSSPVLSNILTDWLSNDLVMDWCRQRAQKNVSPLIPAIQRHPYMPSYIFDAGISTFKGFPVRGVIFYQGESNAHNSEFYEVAFPELVKSWRAFWDNRELPFFYAQLSSIQRPGWEKFRDTQRRMAASIPFSGMVVTSDLGDSLNVHPIRKKEVGLRFANLALHNVYGMAASPVSPELRSVEKNKDHLVLSFVHAGEIKTSDSSLPREFEVAGSDGIFKTVPVRISGNQIIADTKGLDPGVIRYGWKPFSRGNVVNEANLPLSTFTYLINILKKIP